MALIPPPEPESNLSDGEIAGIVIGSVVAAILLLIIVAAVLFTWYVGE